MQAADVPEAMDYDFEGAEAALGLDEWVEQDHPRDKNGKFAKKNEASGSKSTEYKEGQKIKNIFSDYEWMLLQKILRQTIIYPEKRQVAVEEYKKLKIKIAQKWLNSNCGIVEFQQIKEEDKKEHLIDLRVSLQYGEWGFDDVLNFRLPAAIQHQVVSQKVALLDWVNQELESAYV